MKVKMNVGVIGSEKFRNKSFIFKKLEIWVSKDEDIIVSGHSPRRNYDNVDIWAEQWANFHCKKKPIIHPAQEMIAMMKN